MPTYDRVVPYHVSDESGRTASVAAVIVERILPNIVAGENAGLADRLREVASNRLALQHGFGEEVVHPFVATSQAAAARVPDQFGEAWALLETRTDWRAAREALHRAAQVVRGADQNRVRIEGDRTEIARAGRSP